MAQVEINVDEHGLGEVVVDGRNMSHLVRATRMRAEAGEKTTVELEIITGVLTKATGDVEYRVLIGSIWGGGSTLRAAVENLLAQMPEDA